MSPSSVPNFSPIGEHIRVLWRILRSMRNEDEELKRNSVRSYLGNSWTDFLQIWYVDSHNCSKFSSNRIRDHRAT